MIIYPLSSYVFLIILFKNIIYCRIASIFTKKVKKVWPYSLIKVVNKKIHLCLSLLCKTFQASIQIHGNKMWVCMLLVRKQKHLSMYIQVLDTNIGNWSQIADHTNRLEYHLLSDTESQNIRNWLHRQHE